MAETLGPCPLQLQETKKEGCDFYATLGLSDCPLGEGSINKSGFSV